MKKRIVWFSLFILAIGIFGPYYLWRMTSRDTFQVSINKDLPYTHRNAHGPSRSLSAETIVVTCAFSEQLATDPDARTAYQALIDTYKDPVADNKLDPLSMDCLGCHDGSVASEAGYYTPDSKDKPANAYQAGVDAHWLGMLYYSRLRNNDNGAYRKPEQLPSNIRFIQGKVGCLSCHDPFGSNTKHLAISNEGSALCFTCHNK